MYLYYVCVCLCHTCHLPLLCLVPGGLGLVTALTQTTPDLLAAEIDKARDMLEDGHEGQLGVNLTILPMFAEVDYPAYKDVIINSGVKVVETAGRYVCTSKNIPVAAVA